MLAVTTACMLREATNEIFSQEYRSLPNSCTEFRDGIPCTAERRRFINFSLLSLFLCLRALLQSTLQLQLHSIQSVARTERSF